MKTCRKMPNLNSCITHYKLIKYVLTQSYELPASTETTLPTSHLPHSLHINNFF